MFPASRRQFAFYVGLGLFNLSERLHAGVLDDLAAATMFLAPPSRPSHTPHLDLSAESLVHWTAAENSQWRWYERENFTEGQWLLTGITTPVDKQTGELCRDDEGYLDERLVPTSLTQRGWGSDGESTYAADGQSAGQPAPARRSRHGRPPSKWLRSLQVTELRIWLKKLSVPEAGVSGMSYWTHLTRDHSFKPENIDGLSEDEQSKLHAAAHYGY